MKLVKPNIELKKEYLEMLEEWRSIPKRGNRKWKKST